MSEMIPFRYDGADVRVITDENGEPWFVAKDVAGLLGYVNTTSAINQHTKGVAVHYPLHTAGGMQDVRIISEPDVLRLIVNSKLPEAQGFERHVFEVILPSIRKTGQYIAPVPEDDSLLIARALQASARMLAAKDEQIAELTPRAEAFDSFLSADGDYLVGDAAKMLVRAGIDTGPQRLFDALHDFGWTYRGGDGKWRAKQTAVDSDYLVHKPMTHHHPRTGELIADAPQVRITPKGLERLRVRLGRGSLTLVS